MAKDSPNTKTKRLTPFRRFERLAKKIAAVPKGKIVPKAKGDKPRQQS